MTDDLPQEYDAIILGTGIIIQLNILSIRNIHYNIAPKYIINGT